MENQMRKNSWFQLHKSTDLPVYKGTLKKSFQRSRKYQPAWSLALLARQVRKRCVIAASVISSQPWCMENYCYFFSYQHSLRSNAYYKPWQMIRKVNNTKQQSKIVHLKEK